MTLPPLHRAFLERALPVFQADVRLAGVAAGGSFITWEMDEHSDLDLVVVSPPETSRDVLGDGPTIAERLGPLLAAFPGDHVGEPRLLICLYGPPLLHVDLKFLSLEELLHRIEDPAILWDRDGALRAAISRSPAEYPRPRFQWIEDRFWVWVHYTATKINRGELFEAIDALASGPRCSARSLCSRPACGPAACAASSSVRRSELPRCDRPCRSTTPRPVATR